MDKNKIGLLSITFVLTIIVFSISTHMQKQLIDYEPTVSCLVLKENILENSKVNIEMFETADVPVSIVGLSNTIGNYNEIDGLYARDNILKGQIAMKEQFDTKENLSIFEVENGKEKISLKIAAAENGLSYSIKPNSKINVYATIRSDYAKNFAETKERLTVGDDYDGYTVIKIIDFVEVLGVFNVDGVEVESYEDGNIDSIMIAVTPEEAKEINLIRDIATFSITGVSDEISGDAIIENNSME